MAQVVAASAQSHHQSASVAASAAASDTAHGAITEAAHGAAHDAAHEAAHEGAPELPNIISVLRGWFPESEGIHILHAWENVLFAFLVIGFMILIARLAIRHRDLIPRPLQNLVEQLVEAFASFIEGILGPQGRTFVPFLGTLFFYIWIMNLQGLIPFLKSPTSVVNTTLALAITVFLYVQYTGIRRLGILGYFRHLAGDPHDVIGWCLVPLMLPLHIIGEFAKPLSLSLRLFGNIMGEDVLIAVFVGLGVAAMTFIKLPVGLPLQLPFIFLAILTSTIQALVFTLLSTIYFSQVLPHEEEERGD